MDLLILGLSSSRQPTLGTGAALCGAGHPCPVYYESYWDLCNHVWNNNGDVATVRNRGGNVVDRCRYGSAASSPKRC